MFTNRRRPTQHASRRHLHRILLVVLGVSAAVWGCQRSRQEKTAGSLSTTSQVTDSTPLVERKNAPTVRTIFGMEFARVEIDPNIDLQTDPPIPKQTFYIQKKQFGEPLRLLRKIAKSRGLDSEEYRYLMHSSPSEWRDYSLLGKWLSECDPNYDYRFPTKSEWVFACMSGYEQRCFSKEQAAQHENAFGLTGMLNGNVECLQKIGLLMGMWKENWPGIYDGHEKPDCPCQWWTICNPDGDDGLNELIIARYVLVDEGAVSTPD